MFSTALPILSPPSSSLLPSIHSSNTDTSTLHFHPQYAQQRRQKHAQHSRSAVHLVSLDERTITQRKLAIAMYGYSWLKPAGCNKTMLGRREEELEREEVERQLREVELQERMAAEGEREAEAERLAEMRRLELEAEARGGGGVGMEGGERDLDDDIPEADDGAEDEDGDEEEDEDEDEEAELNDEEEDMDGDLDDDIPEADAAAESSWVYDTNRDSDSESDNETGGRGQIRQPQSLFTGMEDMVETEAMVNAMLDEDELGESEYQRNLDDDVPGMDDGNDNDDDDDDMDIDMDDQGQRDLDDDVPEAEDEWQHTDTELEESEMDISVALPQTRTSTGRSARGGSQMSSAHSRRSNASRSSGIGPGTTHEEMRRTSNNLLMMMPPPQLPSPLTSTSAAMTRAGGRMRNITPQNPRPHYHTSGVNTGDSISNLISSDVSSSVVDTGQGLPASEAQQGLRRNWLNPAAARRNLFGGFTRSTNNNNNNNNNPGVTGTPQEHRPPITRYGEQRDGSGFTPDPPRAGTGAGFGQGQGQNQQTNTSQASSGGLFTPDPRIVSGNVSHAAVPGMAGQQEEPRSRTRSGRLLGGITSVTRRSRRVAGNESSND